MVKYSLEIQVKVAVKNKVVQMEINLSSSKKFSQSQSKMVKKRFIIDAEMTEYHLNIDISV